MLFSYYYCILELIIHTDCRPPVTELPSSPIDIQAFCDLIVWRNAPNISYDDIDGYDIRLLSQATNEEVVIRLDTSATFYSLDQLNETLKHESTFIQVSHTL